MARRRTEAAAGWPSTVLMASRRCSSRPTVWAFGARSCKFVGGKFALVSHKRLDFYNKREKATAEFQKQVEKMKDGTPVLLGIADTACAASRPLGQGLYNTLYKLGAPKDMPKIEYRAAWAFIGYKGAKAGTAQHAMGTRSTLLRLGASDPEEGVPGEEGRRQHVDHRRLHRHGPGLKPNNKQQAGSLLSAGASAPRDTMLRLGREHNTKSGGLRQAPLRGRRPGLRQRADDRLLDIKGYGADPRVLGHGLHGRHGLGVARRRQFIIGALLRLLIYRRFDASGFSGSIVVRFDFRHAATAQQTMARTTSKEVVARLRPPREAAWWASVALCAAATARQSAALRNVVIATTGAAVHGPTCSK